MRLDRDLLGNAPLGRENGRFPVNATHQAL